MKLLIADSQPVLVAGARGILSGTGFEVVGEVYAGPKVLPLFLQLRPDVVLLDMHLPGVDGLTCLDRILERDRRAKVVMLSETAAPEEVEEAFRRGACGYVLKSIDPDDLASAIRQAIEGTAYHALGLPSFAESGAVGSAGLTDRETEILRSIARGRANDQIAKELFVTVQTVKFHLSNVYRKIGAANRTEAVSWAYANGFAEGVASLERV